VKKLRALTVLLIIIIVPLGFATKLYDGVYANFVNNSLGGFFYEIFWCLVIFLVFPKINTYVIAFLVFLTTSLLEFSQLLSYPFLETIRSSFIGRSLIGNSFSWSDFIHYFNGAFIGFLILQLIKKLAGKSSPKKS